MFNYFEIPPFTPISQLHHPFTHLASLYPHFPSNVSFPPHIPFIPKPSFLLIPNYTLLAIFSHYTTLHPPFPCFSIYIFPLSLICLHFLSYIPLFSPITPFSKPLTTTNLTNAQSLHRMWSGPGLVGPVPIANHSGL